jgi:tetratricopeptide (TPR) repeat protein
MRDIGGRCERFVTVPGHSIARRTARLRIERDSLWCWPPGEFQGRDDNGSSLVSIGALYLGGAKRNRIHVTGDQNELFDLAARAGSQMRDALLPADDLAPASAEAAASLAANQLALQFYSEGRTRLLNFDFVGARDLLKRAVNADPHYAMAHAALANTFWHLGYGALARSEAKVAVDESQHLPQEFTLAIRGQYEETNPDEALQTIASLRHLPAPIGSDPRIDLMNATVLIGRDLPSARIAAQQAIAKATAQGSTLMIARGYGSHALERPATSTGGNFLLPVFEMRTRRSAGCWARHNLGGGIHYRSEGCSPLASLGDLPYTL